MALTTALVLPLAAPSDLASAGGKGANLGRLARAGLGVPDGFVLTTFAYADFVALNDLDQIVLDATDRLVPDDRDRLAAASAAIRDEFAIGELRDSVASAVEAAYARLGAPPVAVRSSATAEDLPDMSFAGQQDTYLNVVGVDALLESIVSCWSSLWTARAMGYRARNGIAGEAVSMAVVVQVMVDAVASGVLFTANPLTGKRTEVAIDAGLGLGEALVSGQIEPDHYVATPQGAILTKSLGSKAVSIRARDGGGTETREAPSAAQQAIPDLVITELARLGTRVAALFAAPQDVEWAWDGRRLSLLQARAITSLFPLPDGVSSEPLRVLFSFGAVQGMLDPMTPLGQHAIRGLAAGASRLFGFEYTPDTQPVLHTAGERLFMDVSPILAHPIGARLFPRVLSLIEPATRRVFERASDSLRPRRGTGATPWRALPRFAGLQARVLPRLVYALLRPDASRDRLLRTTDASLRAARERWDAATTLPARTALADAMLAEVPPWVITTFGPRMAAGLGSLNALRLLGSGLPEAPDPMEATRGLRHNVTTEMDLELWRTACAIRGDSDAAREFSLTASDDLASRYHAGALPPGAQRAVGDFLKRYGMRGIAEIDLGRARWRENPVAIMQVLQSYLKIDDAAQAPERVFARGAATANAAIARLADATGATRGGWLKRPLVRWLGRRVRALAGLRESPKFYVMRLFGLMRTALLASGQDLVGRGVLCRADDVFFLELRELRAVAEGVKRDWQALVAERRKRYDRERHRRQIPRLMLSDGQAFYDGLGAEADDRDLVGSPVSPGVVEGAARIVHDPQRAHLEPGEILVCRATDPGWTPLFLAAGGLVMEVGGLMTHGAVVAREYGIPAIVGVHQATTRLQSGHRVRVDGSTGRIVLLDDD